MSFSQKKDQIVRLQGQHTQPTSQIYQLPLTHGTILDGRRLQVGNYTNHSITACHHLTELAVTSSRRYNLDIQIHMIYYLNVFGIPANKMYT